MNSWHLLVLSLPTENATVRMRAWRALKGAGAAVLRDGVYVLPDREGCRGTLQQVADDLRKHGGTAYLLVAAEGASEDDFPGLFNRDAEFAELLAEVSACRAGLRADNALDGLKLARKLRRALAGLAAIDFFPGEAQKQVDAALGELETAANRVLSPDEPLPAADYIASLRIADFQGRTWATRRRPWVDRLASAWLIRRCIDPGARFLWLATTADCPSEALGFDFDGAAFSHVGSRVSFETLLASFDLHDPALQRLGQLVHYLDLGGVQPSEASGVERVLAGLRQSIDDDDRLLEAAGPVFDGLLAAFRRDSTP